MFNRKIDNFWIIFWVSATFFVLIVMALYLWAFKAGVILPNTASGPSITGVGMSCEGSTSCAKGLVCFDSSIGKLCLSPIGGICDQLRECVPGTSFCNGKCSSKPGTIASVCTSSDQCQSELDCFPDPETPGISRCYIPEGGARGCAGFYDCQPGSSCVNSKCISGVPDYGNCTSSRECGGSNICLSGKCQPWNTTSPGISGSYCNTTADCNTGLTCNTASYYNLSPGVGYCLVSSLLPGSQCSRFNGCLEIGVCGLDSYCIVQDNMNCVNQKCSIGFTCSANNCLANTGILCSTNADCLSGNCSGISNITIDVAPSISLYNFSKEYTWPRSFNFISMREVIITNNSTQSQVQRNYLTYGNPGDTFFMYNGSIYNLQLDYTIKEVQISQNNKVLFWLQLPNYQKIISRDFSNFSPSVTNQINLTSQEEGQFTSGSIGVTHIQVWDYDPVGDYYYIVDTSQNIMAFETDNNSGTYIANLPGTQTAGLVRHYTSLYNTGYNVNQVVVAYNQNDTPEWFFKIVDTNLSFDLGEITNIEIEFSSTNNIQNMTYFVSKDNKLWYTNVSASSNYKTNYILVPNYVVGTSMVQSILQNTIISYGGNSCT